MPREGDGIDACQYLQSRRLWCLLARERVPDIPLGSPSNIIILRATAGLQQCNPISTESLRTTLFHGTFSGLAGRKIAVSRSLLSLIAAAN